MPDYIERTTARAIVLSPEPAVLLMQIEDPASDRRFWISPGGGIERGEDERSALQRELAEELGRADLNIGPVLYRWCHTFQWNRRWYRQRETFHVVHTRRFEPAMSDDHEARYTRGFRWWSLDDVATSTRVVFSPRDLAEIVRRYLRDGPPATAVSFVEQVEPFG